MREFDRGTTGWFLRKGVPGHGGGGYPKKSFFGCELATKAYSKIRPPQCYRSVSLGLLDVTIPCAFNYAIMF